MKDKEWALARSQSIIIIHQHRLPILRRIGGERMGSESIPLLVGGAGRRDRRGGEDDYLASPQQPQDLYVCI